MRPFDFTFPSRIVGGPGAVGHIGRLVRELGGTQALLLAGPECAAAGVTGRIAAILERDGLAVTTHESGNGDSRSESSRLVAVSRDAAPTVVTVTVGTEPVLRAQRWTGRNPTISVPSLIGWGATTPGSRVEVDGGNTTGTARMTEVVVLDAELSAGTSRDTIASALIDATTHAIEAWVSRRRTVMSDLCAREAWRYLASSFMRLLSSPDDLDAMSAALLGSFLASTAAEHSTLGAAHACARPVSRRYGVPHATALALLLPEVVRWNSRVVADRYAELAAVRGEARRPETLVARLEDLVSAASFPERLAAAGVVESELPTLAVEASADRVGEFNPRKFDVAGALEIYAAAY
jgi:alcohol dehydrogenase class IV